MKFGINIKTPPKPKSALKVTPGRTCDGCTACCKVYEVYDDADVLMTEENKWCSHCRIGVGCRIYTLRPNNCRDYRCLWLDGFFADEDRPDRSKIVAFIGHGVMTNGDDGAVWQLHETTQGAGDTDRCKRIIATLLQAEPLMVGLVRADNSRHALNVNGWEPVHTLSPDDPSKIILP